jgi:hypothetical protein
VNRLIRAIAVTLIVSVGVGFLLYTSRLTAQRDTIAFWAAGHLLLDHRNPYDSAAVLELEHAAGYMGQGPQVVRNPPFALWIALPLGLATPFVAGAIWTLMTVVALFASIRLLRPMFPATQPRFVLLSYLFGPAIACVQLGQYGTVVTLGLICFLRWHESRPFLAGLSLVLVALKPHLLVPFAVVLACWILWRGAYTLLAGALLALVLPMLGIMWLVPGVWHDYLPMLSTASNDAPRVPTFASLVADATGWQTPWLPYLATILGCGWAVWYFASRRRQWHWVREGLTVVVASIWVAPYAWMSDQMVLLPAVVALLTRQRRSVWSFVLVNAVTLIPLLVGIDSMSPTYAWMPTAWLFWYLAWSARSPSGITPAECQAFQN